MQFSKKTFVKPCEFLLSASCLFGLADAQTIAPNTLPSGGNIAIGSGSIMSNGATMTISQDSQSLVTHWDSFDIGTDASVRFEQPSSDSVALGRVLGGNPSQILGALESNGRLFLVNPSGIVFGSSAQVDVGSLVASALELSDDSFVSGDYTFSGVGGSVSNYGSIDAAGGVIALIGERVSNAGQLSAADGSIALLAGSEVTLDFVGDGLISYGISKGALTAEASNSGLIQVGSGMVVLSAQSADSLAQSVVNNTGIVEASGLRSEGGRIYLDAGLGAVSNEGDLLAVGNEGVGGRIKVTGESIQVGGDARIDVSGTSGGGEIYVGGGWQGGDAGIQNAQSVAVGDAVSVSADALVQGNGGTVVFWSDDRNIFAGTISARGGENGGDGGQVEVSGKNTLSYSGVTDARAPLGKTGDLLLDPASIDIVDGGTGAGGITGSIVYEKDLEAQLANITLLSDGYVKVNDLTTDGVISLQPNVSLSITTGSSTTFSMVDPNDEISASGAGSIYLRANNNSLQVGKISTELGKITLYGDDGLTVSNTITSQGGDIEIWADSDNGGAGLLTLNYAVSSNGGNVFLDAGSSGVRVNAPVSTGAGRIYFDTFGSNQPSATYLIAAKISSTGDVTISQPLQFGAGAEFETTGKLTFGSTSSMQNASSTLVLTASDFDFQQNITGNGASVTIAPYDVSTNVDIGATGSGDMTITAANMARFVNFKNITVGRSDGTGTTTVLADTSVNFSGFLELANGTIDIDSGTLANTGGDIRLTGDSFTISSSVIAESGNGSITLQQQTASNPITIGSSLTNAVLAELSAAQLNIGRSDGGDVTFDGNIALTTDELKILSGGDITLGSGVTLDVGTGEAVLAAGGDFINLAGSNPIAASRWLIYSTNPADNSFGGLVSGNTAVWNKTYGSYGPSSVTESGNRYLFSIQPNLTVTASDLSKTYGDTIDFSSPILGTNYTVSGLVDAFLYGGVFEQDAFSGSPLLSSSGSSASATVGGGPYSVAITSGSFAAPDGYGTTNFVAGSMSVNKASLSVDLANDSKTYDALSYVGGNGYVFSGFVNGEDESVLGGAIAYGGSSQGATDAGSYVISGSGLTSNNYTIVYSDGLLTVGKAALTVTLADDKKTYDSLAYAGGNGYIVSGFVGSETETVLGGSFVYGGAAQGAVNVGDYAIVGGGLTSGNYDISYVDGNLSVTKADLVVSLNNDQKVYDSLAYEGGNGYTVSGFVGDEDQSVLDGSIAYGGTSQGAVNVGDYVLSASGLVSDNYAISYVDGALSVTKATLVVQANDASKVYDSLGFSGGNGVSYTGFVGSEDESVLGGDIAYGGAAQGATNAGEYAISASGLSSSNYEIEYADGALMVEKAQLSVVVADDSKVYDSLAYAGGNGYAVEGFVGNEDETVLDGSLVYGGSAQEAINAGEYAISASGLSSSNYEIGYTDGVLTVEKAQLTVTVADDSKVYDSLAYAGGNGYAIEGFVGSEDESVLDGSLVYVGTAQGATNAGEYVISGSGLESSNYELSYVDGALFVEKASLTITANDDQVLFKGVPYSGGNGVAYSGFVGSEGASDLSGELQYSGSSQGAVRKGIYSIVPEGLSSENYAIEYIAGELKIAPPAANYSDKASSVVCISQPSNGTSDKSTHQPSKQKGKKDHDHGKSSLPDSASDVAKLIVDRTGYGEHPRM